MGECITGNPELKSVAQVLGAACVPDLLVAMELPRLTVRKVSPRGARGVHGHMYYIGLDFHKKTTSYCVKDVPGSDPPGSNGWSDAHDDARLGIVGADRAAWEKTEH